MQVVRVWAWSLAALAGLSTGGCTCARVGNGVFGASGRSNPTGTVEHPSGFRFPETLAGAPRVDVHKYNATGTDESAGYDERSLMLTATVYVYPVASVGPKRTLDEHFEQLCKDIVEEHGLSSNVPPTKESVVLSGAARDGRKAVYRYREKYAGTERDLESVAWLFQRGDYFLAFRFTYPVSHATMARTTCDDMMKAFAWPAD